ncbi:MAG: zinc ribbon domain-containing protein [Proteobacteria bacterium]|nr:zinc ribbon domain-containing protein [Pseudomonadota bacterium]
MPIYEYRCQGCGEITSALVLKPQDETSVSCGRCQGNDLKRIVSRFAVHQTETQRLADFDPQKPRDDSFYNDDRNVGLWAKKRAQQLGVDIGPDIDKAVEKTRDGKIFDDI